MKLSHPLLSDIPVHATTERPGKERPVLLWHHGSPQTGAVLPPVAEAAAAAGMDVVSVTRPAYGGAPREVYRDVRSVAAGLERVFEALELHDVISVGASGGGPHALACAAVLPSRVAGVITLAGLAPFRPGDETWFDGMIDPSGLRAGIEGLEARTTHAEVDRFDPESFVAADYRALETTWASLGDDVAASAEWGGEGLIDDDIAFTRPWGFDLGNVTTPVVVMHGDLDRVVPPSHGRALADGLRDARLITVADAGHIAILEHLPEAITALVDRR
ncbi:MULTISPECIES: alpha/beta fold hydrolase [unclassified Microbacterium]|uniref:alpha/beta fold hydrolase n=1 Tax=unclassified Microbacterium TaxID=2609290 RepID=UPI003866BECA